MSKNVAERLKKMSSVKYQKRKKGKIQAIILGLGIVIALFLLGAITILTVFSIDEIEIVGNEYYSTEDIKRRLLEELYLNNTLEFSWQYRNGLQGIEIPMISEIEVEREGTHKIKVRVYEKNLLGYVDYLGTRMYFDKDGIVVESSQEEIEKLPLITGLEFSKITLHEKLEVEKEEVFHTILNLTQLLKDVGLVPERISFSNELNIMLYFGDIKVDLGKEKNLEFKILRLYAALPSVEGQSGTLHMEKMGEGTENIIFTED
jgi:Cell division septal protein